MYNPDSNKVFQDLAINDAFRKAKEVLGEEIIKPNQFEYLYGKEVINTDEKYVLEKEAEFSKNRDPDKEHVEELATVFEGIIHEQAELNEWLGPEVTTIKTSRYDDIKNGVDSVAEFREGPIATSHLAFAIDITFSGDTTKKFNRIREEIDRGELARVKYFVSEHTGFMGELGKIPRVVVGADIRTLKELSELWLERDNKALAAHPIQFQILEEVLIQLEAFEKYATRNKKHELALKFDNSRKIIEKILEEKRKTFEDPGIRDSVFESIQENLRSF